MTAVPEIYVKLAVSFADDPKVRALARYGNDAGLARDLFVQMICHCKRLLTDGFVPDEQIGLLVYPLDAEHGKQLAKQLVSTELISEVDGGYVVLAFVSRNGTRADVERISQVRAEAGRKGGSRPRKPTSARRGATAKQSANQVAERLPIYTETETETETDTTPLRGGKPPKAPSELNVGDIVGAYVDGARASGQPDPPSNLRARVGKQARELVAEGFAVSALIESAHRMGRGEWNDLAVQIRKDAAAKNGRSGSNGHQPYRNPTSQDVYDETEEIRA